MNAFVEEETLRQDYETPCRSLKVLPDSHLTPGLALGVSVLTIQGHLQRPLVDSCSLSSTPAVASFPYDLVCIRHFADHCCFIFLLAHSFQPLNMHPPYPLSLLSPDDGFARLETRCCGRVAAGALRGYERHHSRVFHREPRVNQPQIGEACCL